MIYFIQLPEAKTTEVIEAVKDRAVAEHGELAIYADIVRVDEIDDGYYAVKCRWIGNDIPDAFRGYNDDLQTGA